MQQQQQSQPQTPDTQHSQSDTQIFQMPSNESLNATKDNQMINFVSILFFRCIHFYQHQLLSDVENL